MSVRRALGLVLLLLGCSDGATVTALHRLSPAETDDFYVLPFPSDLRIEADGTVDLRAHPRTVGLVAQYLDEIDATLRGFGTHAAVYFRFDGAIDPASLPKDAAASLEPASSAFIVDVTPGSPTYGERTPVTTKFVGERYDFIDANWLAVQPLAGFPLRENTTYAAVLTDGLRASDGGRVGRAPELASELSDRRVPAYAPLTAWLDTQPGLAEHVVNATVFTTQHVTATMFALREAVHQTAAPVLSDLTYTGEDAPGVDDVYEGRYDTPIFQAGKPPFPSFGSGRIGTTVVRTETLRVAITVPKGAPPAEGWPVVIYAHGTGGSNRSFINDGSAEAAARIGRMAMVGIDQIHHGPRDPTMSDPNLTFANFPNLVGARDSVLQSGADNFQLVRLVQSIDVASAPATGARIKFDPKRIYFKGHSQGGVTGPLFLAAEPEVKAAVLSGAGSFFISSLLHKTKPTNIPALLQSIFQDPIDEYHPALNLVQAYMEPVDGGNHARLLFAEPPAGFAPKSVFQSIGVVDRYTPLENNKALALALGAQPVKPELEPIEGLALTGRTWAEPPVTGNVAGGQATAVVLEYPETGSDGHFVIFRVPAAISQSNRFLATHTVSGIATLEAP